MAISDARKRANKKWNDANMTQRYDRIQLVVPKGQKVNIQAAAEESGESLNGYINRAILCQMGQARWPEALTECEICGTSYVQGIVDDEVQHEKNHNKFIKAQAEYGADYILTHAQQEELKAKASQEADPVKAFEMKARAWYSRSIESYGYGKRHPSYHEFVAMLLNQEYQRNDLPEAACNMLIAKYGQLPGISEGHSYWKA